MLCTYNYSTPDMIDLVLNQLGEDKIKSYYIALGPDRLYSLGYNQTKIEKELGIITFDKDNLNIQIYSNFQIGDRMSLSDIKLKLTNIYNNTGYSKTPKAIDLLEYFEVRDFVYYEKSLEGKRKQIRGYELLKINKKHE